MIPQLIWFALAFIGLGINIVQHGKPKTGKHDAWTQVCALVIGAVILYYGGFFNPLLNR
ncbi:hypothetical protein [Pedobacter nyackensis]|uniref:hypothetical protein n=1 Tax=Pedobacter nyackensis TaxID=475255 RepID=UPI001356621F|nr:hypothetical protein [Pedobacter nyackensis]